MIAVLFFAALAYQLIALLACIKQVLRRDPEPKSFPGVSILKAVRGLDSGFAEAIRTHALLDYPEFEILFGYADADETCLPEILRLQAEFPHVAIRALHCTGKAPNGKVAVLADLAHSAKYPVWVVNDSDISVSREYLRKIVAPLEDPRTGLVTCLYRATASHWPGRWEALGIATDFVPSTLVAPLFGINEFGLGATLAFRSGDLKKLGGFAAIADYLADDYQLGKKISGLGLQVHLSTEVVSTHLDSNSWRGTWRHQVRWARTIRVSRAAGYAGLPITNAGLWALVAASLGMWIWSGALLLARLTMGLVGGALALRSEMAARYCLLMPLRDLWAFAVWIAGLSGRTVRWRDRTLRLDSQGRIVPWN